MTMMTATMMDRNRAVSVSFHAFAGLLFLAAVVMAVEKTSVYIVYTGQPEEGSDPASHSPIKMLTSALGSEEAAKAALLLHYRSAANGFSAKLTPQQAAELASGCQIPKVKDLNGKESHVKRCQGLFKWFIARHIT